MGAVFFACLALAVCTGCSSVASSAPDLGAAPVQQFTETSWPVMVANLPGWEQSNFVFGIGPRIISTGGQGTSVDVRSREGDTLVGLAFSAAGNGSTSAQIKAFTFSAAAFASGGGEVLADVLDQRRPAGFALIQLPLNGPHVMAPGEGLVLQLDATGAGYQATAIQATWTRPL